MWAGLERLPHRRPSADRPFGVLKAYGLDFDVGVTEEADDDIGSGRGVACFDHDYELVWLRSSPAGGTGASRKGGMIASSRSARSTSVT
jgi:hypothetical protein